MTSDKELPVAGAALTPRRPRYLGRPAEIASVVFYRSGYAFGLHGLPPLQHQ